MPTPLSHILRVATRRPGDPLNILLIGATHERTEGYVAQTGHNFYMLQGQGLKTWNRTFARVPDNITILPGMITPSDVVIDVVFSQTRWSQFDIGAAYANHYGCPHVNLAHVLPEPGAERKRADVNVFITDYSRLEWGFDDGIVIEHGVDTDLFKPVSEYHRRELVLAVVNGFVKRDAEVGYTFWKGATEGLPIFVVGDTPGLSKPAASPYELAYYYQTSLIFANTAQRSPVPTTLLEAMSSGCCPVTTRNPMIEDFIRYGENGFICDTPGQMRSIVSHLLEDPGLAADIGKQARQTILERFSLDRFVSDWSYLFASVGGS